MNNKDYCVICLQEVDDSGCPDHKGADFIEKSVLDWANNNGIKINTPRERRAAIAMYFGFRACSFGLCQE